LGETTGLSVDQEAVQTNMVYLETKEPAKGYVDRLAEMGVGCFALGDRLIRLVTHLQIDDEGIEEVIMAFNEVSH
jgi:threonine aldolase